MKSKFRCGFVAMGLLIALLSVRLQADQTYWVCANAQGSKVAQDQPCDPANPARNRHQARPNVVPAVHEPIPVPAAAKDVQSDVQSAVQQARDRLPAVSPESIKWLSLAGLAVLALLVILVIWGLFSRIRRSQAPDDNDGRSGTAGAATTRLPLWGRPKAWSLLLVRRLGAQRFEELCVELWTLEGYRMERPSSEGLGGVSLLGFKSDPAGKPALIIQCQAGVAQDISVTAVRELFGNLGEFGARQAVLVTASDFAADAKVFSGGKPVDLIDGTLLLRKLEALPEARRQSLLKQIARRGYQR